MTLAEFKAATARVPDTDDRSAIIETADGNLIAVLGVRVEDGSLVIEGGRIMVHRAGPPCEPRSVAR